MQIDWPGIRSEQADALHDVVVDLSGWMIPLEPDPCVDYFLLAEDAPCCHTQHYPRIPAPGAG